MSVWFGRQKRAPAARGARASALRTDEAISAVGSGLMTSSHDWVGFLPALSITRVKDVARLRAGLEWRRGSSTMGGSPTLLSKHVIDVPWGFGAKPTLRNDFSFVHRTFIGRHRGHATVRQYRHPEE